MTYQNLINTARSEGLKVQEKELIEHDGLISGNRIAIRKNIRTQTEKACVLAEELGHYHTSSGNILDQTTVLNRKQELKARLWGYNQMIGLSGLISAAKAGCRNAYEIAEYLDVTEEYLKDALEAYQKKYGYVTSVDNYLIRFIPNLQVYEIYPLE